MEPQAGVPRPGAVATQPPWPHAPAGHSTPPPPPSERASRPPAPSDLGARDCSPAVRSPSPARHDPTTPHHTPGPRLTFSRGQRRCDHREQEPEREGLGTRHGARGVARGDSRRCGAGRLGEQSRCAAAADGLSAVRAARRERTCGPAAPAAGHAPPRPHLRSLVRPPARSPAGGESPAPPRPLSRCALLGTRGGDSSTPEGPDVADTRTRLDVKAERDTKSNRELPGGGKTIENTYLCAAPGGLLSNTFSHF